MFILQRAQCHFTNNKLRTMTALLGMSAVCARAMGEVLKLGSSAEDIALRLLLNLRGVFCTSYGY
jgi:hypothetical protein